MNNRIKTLIVCFAALATRMVAEGAGPATVTFDFSIRRSLGEESTLQRGKFFNIHSDYDAADLTVEDLDVLTRELGVGFGRVFKSPFYYFQSKEVPYPTPEQLRALSTFFQDTNRGNLLWRFRTNRRVVTEHPHHVFSMDEDPVLAARYAADFFEIMYTDEDRPAFYEPMNEPFVHAKDYGRDEEAVRLKMALYFKEIGKAFDERGIKTQVVGYSAAWPSMELWDFKHWHTRMKMFMDVAGDSMDGFSFHLYDGTNVAGQDNRRSGANAEAIIDLIETYSMIKWGRVKPHAVTEFGDIPKGYPAGYSDTRSSQELNAINHLLFTLLDRQDRISIAIPFITTKSPWHYHEQNQWEPYSVDVWRPDPGHIEKGAVLAFLPTMKMRFYELWQGVQGERAVAWSDDPDIRVQVFVDGRRTFVCLNNLEDVERTVALQPTAPRKEGVQTRIKRLFVDPQAPADYRDEPVDGFPDALALRPRETVILQSTDAEPVAARGRVVVTSHYSRTYLQPVVENEPLAFEFNEVPTGKGRAVLRMSLGRKHDRSKQPVVQVNGTEIAVPTNWAGYHQANREDFFGAIEIPVPMETIQPTTQVSMTFPDSGGHVSSVVLVTETTLLE